MKTTSRRRRIVASRRTNLERKAMTQSDRPKKRRRRPAPPIAVNEDDRDLLDQYLFEVSKTPLLTPQEEIALARKGFD